MVRLSPMVRNGKAGRGNGLAWHGKAWMGMRRMATRWYGTGRLGMAAACGVVRCAVRRLGTGGNGMAVACGMECNDKQGHGSGMQG
jgi:hypothetical protein